ncbi:hypothetical protein QM012_003305 [Aureobasidium pullulans]|uniref:Xylanolytic transcriptional activator regulatory domain-containing protein n=1 Tax=Aureobasidium pullulans TaxID=5580 RepID=A0ABR0T971_AURPU
MVNAEHAILVRHANGRNREKTATRRRLGARQAPSARPTVPSSTSPDPHGAPQHVLENVSETPASFQNTSRPTFVGQNSLPSLVNTTPRTDGTPSDDMRHTLGLQNTWDIYPYMKRSSTQDLAKEVSLLVPAHQDVLRYSQYYQSIVWPFYPHIPDSQELESLICVYLERSSARETSGSPIFSGYITQSEVARTSLMLAVLASGVHFSDQPPYQRKSLSQEYARRAFHCARLSNFLLRPTLESIQALLVLGHVLQNNGQADASWALLGTTIRLAQSLGLHSDQHAETLSNEVRINRHKTWRSLLWQDSLLSLSFDRPPARASVDPETFPPEDNNGLSYIECMYEWSQIGRQLLEKTRHERANVDTMLQFGEKLDQINSKSQPHLRMLSACTSRQSRMEHHAFRLQQAFCSSFVCRPALLCVNAPEREDELQVILGRAQASLLETIQAFMALQSLTVLPLRSWSMIHAAIGAALLLQVQERTAGTEETRTLQNSLINALSRECSGESGSASSQTQPWLSVSHLRALRTLQGSLTRRPLTNEIDNQAATTIQERPQNDTTHYPTTNLLSETELADLAMDNFGNIEWGKSFRLAQRIRVDADDLLFRLGFVRR